MKPSSKNARAEDWSSIDHGWEDITSSVLLLGVVLNSYQGPLLADSTYSNLVIKDNIL